MKKYLFYFLPLLLLWCSGCFDDKGNYTYKEVNGLSISGILEEYSYLGNVDTLDIRPVVTSSAEGVISADDPDYTFMYKAAVRNPSPGDNKERFVLDSSFTKDIYRFADILPRKYDCWFSVRDERTGISFTQPFILNIGSSISEGWMVLCNEGADERVRLDMITVISSDRIVRAVDLLPALGLPPLHHAVCLGWNPYGTNGEDIYVFSQEGGYRLDPGTFQTGEEYNVFYEFGDKKGDCCPVGFGVSDLNRFVVTRDGNAYTMSKDVAGGIYQLPVNTTVSGSEPQFKVSPQFAIDVKVNYQRNTSVIFYDITNKRFVVSVERNESVLLPLENPADSDKLFDYQTGKELVYLQSTLYADGTAYALLKDDEGRFFICGIAYIFKDFTSELKQQYYSEVVANDLNKATAYAFHPTLPYLFYAAGCEIHEYDLVNKNERVVARVDSKEKINLLKFNVFKYEYATGEKPDHYLNQQYQLIVGSEDGKVEGINNGVLRFYTVSPLNADLVMKGEPYRGFAKIADVVYRERK